MRDLVRLLRFEEKVGDTKLYYNGPTLDASIFRYLILWCTVGAIKSYIVGPGVFDLAGVTLFILGWGVVDYYYAKRALKIMKKVVAGGGIKVESIDLADVNLYAGDDEIDWKYREFKGTIEIKYENKSGKNKE
jgi:hypothetical protein